jgi:ferric-dicitrate binding protein FerR (iron transport regulator)
VSDVTSATRRQEAARWFAASRRGVMSIEERAAYARWRSDAVNAATLAEFEQVWHAVDKIQGLVAGGHPEAATLPQRGTRFARPALVAAMCAVSLAIGVLSYSGDSQFWTALDWTAR